MPDSRGTSSRSASVKDVAAAPGSPWARCPTSSTGPSGSAPHTRARVEQAMADLGFVRNESARQLRAGRTGPSAT